jgi:glycosyltransferase involved in cell wall biosynthesis
MAREEVKKPLVSIIIPTYNEEKTLPKTLESIKKQTYPNIEVIVIDSNSTDNTKNIAKSLGARVINYEGKLLGARHIGIKKARGKYILLLDADQILEKKAVENALKKMENCDMLVFEEQSYKPHTLVEKAFAIERKWMHEQPNALDPIKGDLVPRFFKKDFIEKVFNNIPNEIIPKLVVYESHIMYYEALKFSKKIKVLPKAVFHIEEKSLLDVWRHYYRFGKSAKIFPLTIYSDFISKKRAFLRNLKYRLQIKSVKVMLVSFLRFIAYTTGYFLG